jgi:transcriptional regulator with XRE-family HTH domain
MATRDRPGDRGRRNARQGVGRLAVDGRNARVGAGVSLRVVADAIGVSHGRVGRFERGEMRSPDTDFLGAYFAVLGMELSLRAYPVGDAMRDRGQRALLERLHRELHPSLTWRTEVPLPNERDLRAWDAEIRPMEGSWRLRVEAEMRISDGQALERRLTLKVRDGGEGHLLLLVANTRANRLAMPSLGRALETALPVSGRAMLSALRAGRDPGGSGIVML